MGNIDKPGGQDMRYRLIIFDWDGTLMDSAGRIVQCVQRIAAEMQLPVPTSQAVREGIGLDSLAQMQRLFPAQVELHGAFMARFRAHYQAQAAEQQPQLFPGVTDLLQALIDQGLWLAVATGMGRAGLNAMLKQTGLTDHFVTTRTADDSLSKPHPQMLEDILAELDLNPAEALMVGDTVFDLQMAKALGMDAVAVTTGVHDKARLLACEPLTCLDDITRLATLVT